MKSSHGLMLSICALVLTIVAAYFASKNAEMDVVRAEEGECWQSLDSSPITCYCDAFPGLVNIAITPGAGIGFISSRQELRTCDVGGPNNCQDYVAVAFDDISCPTLPTPTPTPTPTPPPSCIPGMAENCIDSLGQWIEEECYCDHSIGPHTPIIIDVEGDGFALTNAANGVYFDFYGDGEPEKLGWTALGSDEVFLVLDRNGNGKIDHGSELFGNKTPQPEPPIGIIKNGFLALAEFDKIENGGNGDGVISRADGVFTRLRLWNDSDHNGRSRNSELFRLPQLGLRKIDLDYESSRRVDEFGNRFRWRSRVRDANDAQLGRWAWDVILTTE